MQIPAGSTTYSPAASPLHADEFRGRVIRHTFRRRGTADWLLIYTTGGSGLYRLADGAEYRSRAGDVTLFRPGVFHDYQFAPEVGRWDLLWAHFLPRPEWSPWLDWPEIGSGLMRLNLQEPALRARVARRLREVIRLHRGSSRSARDLGLNALEEVLLWCDSVNPLRSGTQPDPRIARALELLTRGLNEPFSEEKTARAVGLSASRFRHLFREQMRDSARNYHEKLRIQRARDLLALSRHTVGEIAGQVGFANPFYFTLRFKKHLGESPRAYRQRMTGAA